MLIFARYIVGLLRDGCKLIQLIIYCNLFIVYSWLVGVILANIFLVSAPSGAGKTSLLAEVIKQLDNIKISISYTTRSKRSKEIDGLDYNFVSVNDFMTMVDNGQMLEYAQVFNNYYGTSKVITQELLAAGTDVILEIDWQGAAQVKQLMPDAISIFIIPPSLKELKHRLLTRQQDTQAVIEVRMQQAELELAKQDSYDYIVMNSVFTEAVTEMRQIIQSYR